MFARPSSVKLVGQYFILFDCSFYEHEFACGLDMRETREFLIVIRVSNPFTDLRNIKNMGVWRVHSGWAVSSTSRSFEILAVIL